MDKNQDFNLRSLCRTCLDVLADTAKYEIFETPELLKKITLCTSLTVEPLDGLPPFICANCYRKLNEFEEFQKMCVDSVQQLNDMISANKIASEINIQNFEMLTFNHEEAAVVKKEDNDLRICKDDDVENFIANEEMSSDDEAVNSVNKLHNELSNNNRNIDTNGLIYIYSCKKCPRRFYKEHRYNAHKRIHEGLKPYACPHCDSDFVKAYSLALHIQYVHGTIDKSYQCTEPGCGRSYRREQTLKWHMRNSHKQGPALPEPKKSVCELCGKIFKNFNNLKKHRYSHTGEELPFGCTMCNKRYITKHKLKEHMMRHLGEKNFICPYCGIRKITEHELRVHMNSHTREVIFSCWLCSMQFNSAGNLKRHVRIVHEGIKNYKCQYCDKSFGKDETRKHHEMIHTGEKPHECPMCHKRFIQLIAMRTHLKRHKSKEDRNLRENKNTKEQPLKQTDKSKTLEVSPKTEKR